MPACLQPDQVMSEGLAQFYFRQIVVGGATFGLGWVGRLAGMPSTAWHGT